MSLSKVAQIPSTTLKSVDLPKTPITQQERLNSTARVFCEACNQIAKAYLNDYNETNVFQTINMSFAEKVISKTKISFSQLVITLIYLNRYYKACTQFNKHIPGHEEAEIPSLSHVILLCIIQAERYITDIPHKLSWWAGVCSGQTKPSDINKWQRIFLNTINFNLYIHPEKDYNVFKIEVKRLGYRLFSNSLKMPPQFRRSVNLGAQGIQNSVPSSQSNHIPSQPNIVRTESTTTVPQPRILLSPHYSGHGNVNSIVNPPQRVLSNHVNIVASPVASTHNSIIANQTHNLDVPVLNITNTNLTTSPMGIDGSMINQTRSPNSMYTNSIDTNGNQLQTNTLLLPIQNPNHLMVNSSHRRSPIRNNAVVNLNNSESPSILTTNLIQSPIQYKNNMTNSPVDMIKAEKQELNNVIHPKPIKRKRSYYDISSLSKIVQDFKKAKVMMTISPEELDYQSNTSNTTRPMEKNKKNDSIPSIVLMNQKIVVSPSTVSIQSKDSSTSNQEENYRIQGDEQVVNSMNKGKDEAGTSSHSFRSSESLNIENTSEVLPSSSNENTIETLGSNDNTSNDEIIYSSLLANNSLALIPVSPPLTPQ